MFMNSQHIVLIKPLLLTMFMNSQYIVFKPLLFTMFMNSQYIVFKPLLFTIFMNSQYIVLIKPLLFTMLMNSQYIVVKPLLFTIFMNSQYIVFKPLLFTIFMNSVYVMYESLSTSALLRSLSSFLLGITSTKPVVESSPSSSDIGTPSFPCWQIKWVRVLKVLSCSISLFKVKMPVQSMPANVHI